MDLIDVFMRKCRVKFDVKECRGQLAVECGDDPLGGLSTLSAHQMAHGGVIPHTRSFELSAHQMPTRLTSAKLQRLRLLFGAKTREGRVRGHMMWLPHHPGLGKGVERGHTMCLPHLTRILTVFTTKMSWGLGLLGRTRKPWGRVQFSIPRVLVGPSMKRALTPVMRVKNKRARDIAHITTVHQ